jgi:hypothetical protein
LQDGHWPNTAKGVAYDERGDDIEHANEQPAKHDRMQTRGHAILLADSASARTAAPDK